MNPWQWDSDHGKARSVTSDKRLAKALKVLDADLVLIDTETDGLAVDRKLRLVQIARAAGGPVYVADAGDLLGAELICWILRRRPTLCGHNLAFDLLSLAQSQMSAERACEWAAEMATAGKVRDTMVAAQVADSVPRVRKLAALAEEAGVPNTHADEWHAAAEEAGQTPEQMYADTDINDERYLRYSAHDIFQLRAVAEALGDALHRPLAVTETQADVLYSAMTHRGMRLDLAAAEALYADLHKEREAVRLRLVEAKIQKEGSTAQVAKALKKAGAEWADVTATGRPSVTKYVLRTMVEDDDMPERARRVAADVLLARSRSKDMAQIDNLAGNSHNGRVHPTLWRIGAVTGRSSCAAPNLQQLNRRSGDSRIRGLLRADKGERLVSLDFDGVELRALAELSGDPMMTRELLAGVDMHGALAESTFGAGYSAANRDAAKTFLFAMIYGAGDRKLEQSIGAGLPTRLRSAWRDRYPVAAAHLRAWADEAEDCGFIELPNGWTPRVPEDAAYRAANYMIQGYAAFIFRDAVRQVAEAGLWSHVRMVVHDELVMSVPAGGEGRVITDRAAKAMTVRRPSMVYTVGITRHGKRWGA